MVGLGCGSGALGAGCRRLARAWSGVSDDGQVAYVIAQLSDTHIGGPHAGSGERLSMAISEINAMGRPPDLVLLTGDLTHDGTTAQWDEVRSRLAELLPPWEAIRGNHDHDLPALAGHRTTEAGPLRLVLLDTSREVFTTDDAAWLDDQLRSDPRPTIVALHHPPFETGIWWMDSIGLDGQRRFEDVVRRHAHVLKVLSGHVHRAIQTQWGSCSLWVGPSTAVAVAVDLDPAHAPAESAEPPAFSLHAYTAGGTIVSHVVPVGPTASRRTIEAPELVERARGLQRTRRSDLA